MHINSILILIILFVRVHQYGADAFFKLSRRFNVALFVSDPEFDKLFVEENRLNAIKTFARYMVQRFGGIPDYTEKRGFPSLISRHAKYNISEELIEKWLCIMDDAISEMADIFDIDGKRKLMNFFRHTAYTFIAYRHILEESSESSGDYAELTL